MVRTSCFVVLAGLLALLELGGARAADAPTGNFKLAFLNQGRMATLWLISLENKGDTWTGSVVAGAEGVPPGATVENVKVSDGIVRFAIRIQRRDFGFEGKVPKEAGKTIFGSMALGGQMVPAQLEPTKVTSFDAFEMNKEIVAKGEGGPELFNAALELLKQAGDKKAKPDEVRGWANKAFTAAEPHGPRWQREISLRIADVLSNEEFGPVALEYARKAKRLVEGDEDFNSQMRVLNLLTSALKKAKKDDEAKEIEAEADALYQKKMPPFKAEKFEGPKKKGGRTVLVELFTGAQCPPCVAADLAFDAVEKTYQPADVILLQYHLHIPGPDPLTNEDNEARSRYYEDEVEGTPTVLFNGKLGAGGGGGLDDAKDKYKAYREVIEPQLEKGSAVKIKAKAVRKGDKIDISAEASDLEMPGEKVRLRLALVEELVKYTGGNNLRFHHRVVRSLPGGAEGVLLKDKTGKQEITVDLGHLKESLNKYLNEFGKRRAFPNTDRPMDLKNLYVVAFVQNDATKEVLQAVQVKVEAE